MLPSLPVNSNWLVLSPFDKHPVIVLVSDFDLADESPASCASKYDALSPINATQNTQPLGLHLMTSSPRGGTPNSGRDFDGFLPHAVVSRSKLKKTKDFGNLRRAGEKLKILAKGDGQVRPTESQPALLTDLAYAALSRL
jgi:hypothetical protein